MPLALPKVVLASGKAERGLRQKIKTCRLHGHRLRSLNRDTGICWVRVSFPIFCQKCRGAT